MITVLDMNGFKDARPDRLPLSASVWDIAQRYNKGGPTVTEALYEALKELEAKSSLCSEARVRACSAA